ncbi:MAG: hypothetical protein WH035_06085 [Spirochaetota bacterium]
MNNFHNKKFLLLFVFIILFSFSFQGVYSNYNKLLNIDEMKKLKYIETVYDVTGKGKSSIETIKYFFDNTLYIEETCIGEYGNGYYTISTDQYFRPLVMETKWISEYEKADCLERFIYNYENETIVYINLKNSQTKTFQLSEVTGDSVTLGELIIFINTNNLKNFSTGGLIVPNAYKAPFIFRYVKTDNYKINGELINEEVYKAEINNPFLQFLAVMFGNKAEIHLKADFPHIRTRSFYSIRNIFLKEYKIIKK